MNGDRDLDRVLERWLSEGASEMPDRLFDAVTDRIERVPQARVARLHLRFFDMKRYQRFAAAGAAVLLIAIGGSAVLARLSDRNDGVSPAPPTTLPSSSPAPSAGASLPARGADRRPDPGRRTRRTALVRRRRHSRSGSTSPRAWCAWTWRRPPSRDQSP